MKNIQPKDIYKGDELWECSQYGSIKFKVKDEPTHIDGKWEWIGIADDKEIHFLITDGAEHYGPRIYDEDIYYRPDFLNSNEQPSK